MKKLFASFPLHPIIFSLFPIIFLYAHNIKELRINVVWYPLYFTILIALLIYTILYRLYRNSEKAAVLSSLVIIIFFSHGDILDLLFETPFLPKGIYLIGIWIVALFFTVRFLNRTKANLRSVNIFLTIVSLLLLVTPILTIISTELNRTTISSRDKVKTSSTTKAQNPPDIYYFIFEEYSSSKVLSENHGFDNKDIENFLTSKGFYVAKDATSNYPKTFLSLASSFNYEYLDFLTDKTSGGVSADQTVVNPLIEDNKLVAFLKSKGYKYYHLGSWWPPTGKNRNADINFVSSEIYLNLDEFTLHLLDTTIVASIIKNFFPQEFVNTDGYINHRNRTLYTVDRLKNEVPKLSGPKFVFAHLLIPHEPFVFGDNCQKVDQKEIAKEKKSKNFINQIKCTNKFIKEITDTILEKSKKPPVIVIQADEGELPIVNVLKEGETWSKASVASLKEKFGIFNAYYLPGMSVNLLYPDITPVNTFRLILDQYFEEKLSLLPDKNYIFPDLTKLYQFIDVTRKIK